jgi:pimeloyl-ACP methyl ester carboxylesterase
MGVRRSVAVVLAVLAGFVACSGDDDAAPSPSSPPTTRATADTEVRNETITIEDAAVGELTFDVLAAGDPDAAADGRLVLLLHGFPETSESFREILPVLAEAGYYAVAPNQRGYSAGARPDGVEPYNILHLVDDVVAMADELGADRYHVVGHDWGGAVAWLTAAFHADDVASLAALSTPHPDAISTAMVDPNQTQSQVSSYMTVFRAEGSENQFLANGAEAFFTGIGIPQEKAAAYAEVLGTPEALGAGLNWYRANPLPTDARIGPVTVPTLYIWGDEDIAFARSTAEATASYVDPATYTFQELTGRGHWLPEEAPDEIATALVEHLDSM